VPKQVTYLHALSIPSTIDLREAVDKDVNGIIKRVSYINYSPHCIYVLERSGLVFSVKNVPNRFSTQFIIRCEYTIPFTIFEELAPLFSKEINKETHPDLFSLKELFFKHCENSTNKYKSLRLVVDTVIEHNDLKTADILYIYNQDIVISNEQLTNNISHPFNGYDKLKERYQEISKTTGTHFSIEIIDNEELLGERYFYVADRLFKVIPFKDKTRTSGIYFIISDFTRAEPRIDIKQYEISEAETVLGLYKTKEIALSSGDLKLARQEEIARLMHESSVNKIEINKLESKHSLELERIKIEKDKADNIRKATILELESEIAQKEIENKLLEAANEREKRNYEKESQLFKFAHEQRRTIEDEYYSQKMHKRKDLSELIKTIGVIAVGVISIAAIVLKAK
jgi:hypothetical protein